MRIFRRYNLKKIFYSDTTILSGLKSNPSLKIYYVTTGQFKSDTHYQDAYSQIKNFFDDDPKGDYFENVEIEVIDAKKTRKKVESLENNQEVLLNIQKSMILTVGENENVKKAVSFTCSAGEFLRLLQTEDGSLRRTLFNDNVRDYLGPGNINKEIEATMLKEPELFLLCNNGVTIVSSNFESIKDDLVKIVNPQIVNGCQTSNTLYKLRNEVDKDKLLLSVRVICTDDNEISNKVVRSTNRQNQVLEEAFETTKPFHHELEKMFALTSDPVQLYYERRSRQYEWDSKIRKAHIITLRCLTHVFVAAFISNPHEAHRHEAKLLEKFVKNTSRIFCINHSLKAYYLCGLLYYRLEEAFKNDLSIKKYTKFRGHLYYIIRALVTPKVPVLSDSSKDFKKFVEKMMEVLRDQCIFKAYLINATKVLDKTLALWVKAGKSQYGFKDHEGFTELLKKEISKKRKEYNI